MANSTANQVLRELERFNIKKDGSNRWRCNSPFRPNSDSMSFAVTIDNDEHGAYFDHVTQEKGSLYDLAKQLGIAIPTAVNVQSTKRAYAGLDDYAKAHGLHGDLLREMQWREVIYQQRPALEFPTATGRRWRFIDGAKGKPVYISESGYTRCWYLLGTQLIDLLKMNKPLVLCNGEISTITARYYGVPSLAMTSGEKAEIPDELLKQLKGHLASLPNKPEIIIALDCDSAGRKSARGIEAQLREHGFNARAVDLGLSTGGDLADFCMLNGLESLEKLTACKPLKQETEKGKWHFATIDDVLNLPTIDWLVPRQIPSRGLSMIYGASGSYKSFYILDHSLKLAQTGTNILYIAAEGEHGYRQRLQAWIKYYNVKPQNITFVLGSVDLFDADDQTEFTRIIEQYKPKMVVVDTFAMCSGIADENNARDMLQIVNGCKNMSKGLDAVIVIVHHTNAEGKKERGSKVFRNACDTIIRLSLDDDMILVESQKTKDTSAFEPYRLAPLAIDLGYVNNINEPVTSVVLIPAEKMVKENALTPLQYKVLEVLSVQPGASLAEIADAVECDSRGSISNVIRSLSKKGFISVNGTTRDITPNGTRVLNGDTNNDSVSSDAKNDKTSRKTIQKSFYKSNSNNYDDEDL